jgi:anaerobic selenocysteine-containing dehydrogenase
MIKGKIPGRETGIEIRKSLCTICDPTTQCGLDCYVKDGRIIKVEGSLENPSAGTLCSKGAAQRQWVYHEERLRTPLKRVGPRGSDQFVPISWSEALDTIAANLNRLKAENGPESVVFYCGYPKQLRPFLQRLALSFGPPNYCTESSTCFTAMAMGWRLDYGSLAAPDIGRTKCLMIWTGNAFYSRTPGAAGLLAAKERGV